MSRLDGTLMHLAPGVGSCRELGGRYNPRRGLAIYHLPVPGYAPASPGMVLGEAMAARSGLGCTLLEGVPRKIPEGAALVANYAGLKACRPDLLEDIPELTDPGSYAIKLGRSALIVSPSPEGMSSGMQTLAMLVLRHTEDYIPGCVIVDAPFCQTRCLTVPLEPKEISIALLMQIVSFAATFKANQLHLLLDERFNSAREIPGMETFVQACQSFGIGVGVRMPLLAKILSGEKTLIQAWAMLRAAARVFGASQAAVDDPCPPDVDVDDAYLVVESVADGEIGLRQVALDANLILRSGFPLDELRPAGVYGWHRMWETAAPPPPELEGMPLILDVQAPIAGFTSRTANAYFRRLDAAAEWLRPRLRRWLDVSFRGIGVSHLWQNLLYPSAAGLIAAWGNPKPADAAGLRFSNLLYGEPGRSVMDMWETIAGVFPPGLSDAEELLLRRTAFGEWPESDAALTTLSGIDWLEVAKNIRIAADALKNIASGLQRNAMTLSGARLSLHAMSWLHCFVALAPELDRRRRLGYDADGRTEPIADELLDNFHNWETRLNELHSESGLELVELDGIRAMGLRLKGLCEDIFE